MSDNRPWYASIREWFAGHRLPEYSEQQDAASISRVAERTASYVYENMQLKKDLDHYTKLNESNEKYIENIIAENNILKAHISLMEQKDAMPTKRRKRK